MIIKICGITSAQDARAAWDAGADWIGINLVGGPRRVASNRALAIIGELANPQSVAALVRAEAVTADKILLNSLGSRGVKRLQLYGEVTPQLIERLQAENFEVLFVHSLRDGSALEELQSFLDSCALNGPQFVVLDAYMPDIPGGTGKPLDWNALHTSPLWREITSRQRVLLAGGLNPENVSEAIRLVKPAGVDVSSGVETTPGRKDCSKMERFCEAVRRAAATAKGFHGS